MQYAYDEDGRLLATTDPNSDTAVYHYDAVGNLLSIARHPSSQLSIVHVTPSRGLAGSSVTITGTGFDTVAANDTVTFGGVVAAVQSASATRLVAQVPSGALLGPVGVSVGGTQVASDTNFTPLGASAAPTISAVSATIASAGSTLTISGSNFTTDDLTADRIAFNTMRSYATAGTATSLTAKLPDRATSGPVSVATVNGKAQGPDVFVPPPGFTPATIASTARTMVDGATTTIGVATAGRGSLLLFDAAEGQRLTANLTWTGGLINFTLFDPVGQVVWTSAAGFVDAFTVPANGTYTLLVAPPTGTGTATVQVHSVLADATASLTIDGGTVSASNTAIGQNVVFSFSGTAGQRVSFQYSYHATVVRNICAAMTVRSPDWSTLQASGCVLDSGAATLVEPLTLPMTGSYALIVDAPQSDVGQATAEAWTVPADVAVALTLGGAAINASNTVRAQNVVYSFAGTTGQRVALRYSYRANPVGNACVRVTLQNPDLSALLTNTCALDNGTVVFVDPVTLPQTGTYTLVVDPPAAEIGQAMAEAWSVPADAAATLTIGGAAVTAGNTVRGQNIGYTFSGATGQRVSFQYSYRGTAPLSSQCVVITMRNPDTTALVSTACAVDTGTAVFVDPLVLPQTGTYSISVNPGGADVGTASAEVWTVPADVATTMSIDGGAVTATSTVRGQNIGYTFSGTTGQRVAFQYSFRATPPASSQCVVITVRNPDATSLVNTTCAIDTGTKVFVEPLMLPQTGTYAISVNPGGADVGPASAEVWTVPADVAATLTIDGGSVNASNTVRGQNISYTFPGTQGRRVSFRFSYLANPVSNTCVVVTVKNPDNTTLLTSSCVLDTGAVTSPAAVTLPQAGTYTVLVNPGGADVGQATVQATTAALAPRSAAVAPHGGPALTAAHRSTSAGPAASSVRSAPATPEPAAAPAAASPVAPSSLPEEWHPSRQAGLPDDFRTHRPRAPAQDLAPLQAQPGVTAISGQALRLNGDPLPGVTLTLAGVSAKSDATGRFLLAGLPAGHAVMTIDGTTANSARATYGTFEVGIDVPAGRTTALPFTVWMTRLDTAHEITIPSPTTSEVVLTTPDIPGLEVHLPAGTVIEDRAGKPVTKLSLTAIPVDRPPFPLPMAVQVPVYFTVQPGGSYVWPKGARIVYPNFTHLAPGSRVQFWDYDAGKKGWYVYGQGTVTSDGTQVVPDAGVAVWTFSGAMIDGSGFTKWLAGWLSGALGISADPVDLGTGTFAYQKTDLVLPGTVPIDLTRTHIQGDTLSRAFGVGMTWSLDINLFSENQYQEVDLYLPGNAKIHYVRTSAGTGFTDAVFQTTATTSGFYGSIMAWNGAGWNLTLKDGTTLVFPDNSPLHAIRDRNGNQITLVRANGNLGSIVEALSSDGRWLQLSYDGFNRVTSATDNLGRTVHYTYDAGGHLFQVTDPQGGVMTYHYDGDEISTVTDARGQVFVTNTYDTNRRVATQTLADQTSVYHFDYTLDAGGKVSRTDVTDPRGLVRRVQFDGAGQMISDTEAVGLPEQLSVSLTRDPTTELVTAITDSSGRRAKLTYDGLANVKSVTRMDGTAEAQTMTLTYEPRFNQVSSITDPLGHPTTFTYDDRGNLTGVRDALGHGPTIVPGPDGQPKTVLDALGHPTNFTYDLGDLSTVTDPLGRTSRTFMDGAGRVVSSIDPLGSRTVTHYDVMNEVLAVVDPTGATTQFEYDPNGNLDTVTDANGHETTYHYDSLDRVDRRTDPLLRETHYGYDADGELTTLVNQRGQTTTISYDGLGRRSFAGFNAVTTGGVTTYDSTITYGYDTVGRLARVTDSLAGQNTFGYDDYDRLTSVVSSQGTVGYGYDNADRLMSETIGMSTVGYHYDDANRLTSITRGTTTLVGKTYDDADRLRTVTLPDGIVETYGYDDASQLSSISYALGATTLGALTYGYDAGGLRTSADGAWARTGLPQPVSSATYDAANQLSTWNGTSITYDADGNLTGDGTRTYTWDARGQLTGVSGPGVTASYGYDGLGRRTQSTVNGSTQQFLYDGSNVAQEQSGGTVSASILSGGTDEYFSRTDAAGTRSYLTDALGSTVALADGAGTVQTSYTYEPFGKATASGAADANREQFTGRENDATGLQYNRARYYSPTLQRFVSQDPLGFGGGDVNTSAYAGNSPTNATDPSGMFIWVAMLGGCVAGAAWSLGSDLIGAKLTGRKLDVGEMLVNAGMACLEGAALGVLGGFLGELLGPIVGQVIGGLLAKGGRIVTRVMGPGADSAARSLATEDLANLASPSRTEHVIAGHLSPGEAGNTMFPPEWSSDQVMHAISDIATDPSIPWTQQSGRIGAMYTKAGDPTRFNVIGFRGGIWIKVIIEPAGEGIITGYPI